MRSSIMSSRNGCKNLGLTTISGPSLKYWWGLSGPRRPWLRRKCSMQAPTATALFFLPGNADDSETPSPYFNDGPLARRQLQKEVLSVGPTPRGALKTPSIPWYPAFERRNTNS
jgi:hypothetical protein